MTEKIKEQILAVRDSGLTNMFDARAVQVIANNRNFYELVVYIEEHLSEYFDFILYGDQPDDRFGADDKVIIIEE